MSFRVPPIPTYERDLVKLEATYKDALQKLTKMLVKTDPTDLLRSDIYKSLIQQITFVLNELNADSKVWIEQTLTKAFGEAQAQALVTMGLAGSLAEAKGMIQFTLLARNKIESMIADTFSDVLKATTFMDDKLKQLVRDRQAEVLRVNTALMRGSVTTGKDLKQALKDAGFSEKLIEDSWKGIIDSGGRRWDLTTYTSMVARTKLQQAHIEATKLEAREAGSDLAVISSHGAKDACRHFEGMIISLEGKTKGYKTLDEVRASNLIFHPNCQHSVHAIGDIDAFPQALKQKSLTKERDADIILRNAKEVKKQYDRKRFENRKQRKQEILDKKKKALAQARKALSDKRKNVVYNWVEAKSIPEASKWAMDNLGIKQVNYKGFNLDFANDLNKHLEVLSKEYPEVMAKVHIVATAQERNRQAKATYNWRLKKIPSNVFAQATDATWKDFSGITYNEVWAKDYDKFKQSVADCVTSKWHPVGTESPTSVLTHEFGHQVDYFLRDAGLRDRYIGLVQDAQAKGRTFLDENLSRYANTNDYEVIAEAFAEYKHNPNPRPLAKSIGEAMDNALEEYRRSVK